jgi:hypothetical protein
MPNKMSLHFTQEETEGRREGEREREREREQFSALSSSGVQVL